VFGLEILTVQYEGIYGNKLEKQVGYM